MLNYLKIASYRVVSHQYQQIKEQYLNSAIIFHTTQCHYCVEQLYGTLMHSKGGSMQPAQRKGLKNDRDVSAAGRKPT